MKLQDYLEYFDFSYKLNENNTLSLIDYQGANLGNIENEKFEMTSSLRSSIVDRLDTYYSDYIFNDLAEYLDSKHNVKIKSTNWVLLCDTAMKLDDDYIDKEILKSWKEPNSIEIDIEPKSYDQLIDILNILDGCDEKLEYLNNLSKEMVNELKSRWGNYSNHGYAVFCESDGTLVHIEHIDEMNVFESDLQAKEFAINDGLHFYDKNTYYGIMLKLLGIEYRDTLLNYINNDKLIDEMIINDLDLLYSYTSKDNELIDIVSNGEEVVAFNKSTKKVHMYWENSDVQFLKDGIETINEYFENDVDFNLPYVINSYDNESVEIDLEI